MVKAKKLPSGNWRALVYDYTDVNKKKIYKSFTASTKKEAEYLAAEYQFKKKEHTVVSNITLYDACKRYIDSKENVLSPSTIREYERIRDKDFCDIMHVKLKNITCEMIQNEVNTLSKKLAPKTVKNRYGLLNSVLKTYHPDLRLTVTLPQQIKKERTIPTEEEVKLLLEHSRGLNLESPILLATFGSLRCSEISAINTATDIKKGYVIINKAMVKNKQKEWVIASRTKSVAGVRRVYLPDYIIDKLKTWDNNLVPSSISNGFIRLVKKIGITYVTFHSLRHFYATFSHVLGIPDKYIMEQGGWSSKSVLQNIYQHTLDSTANEMNKIRSEYFNKIQHEIQHKK